MTVAWGSCRFRAQKMSVHEAQTAILVWLWENDGAIMDGEAMQIALADDGPWELTIAGREWLESQFKASA